MKYYIDTEFLEGTQKEKFPISLFRKNTPPTIDLISIGIVAEDGREYYAVSKDFNLEEAWNRYDEKIYKSTHKEDEGKTLTQRIYWIRENVLLPLWREFFFKLNMGFDMFSNKQTEVFYDSVMNGYYDKNFSYRSLKAKINRYGKTNKEIAEDVIRFCSNDDLLIATGKSKKSFVAADYKIPFSKYPEFYAYYADYDWVGFCWLFGKMMDLPKGFPMYCIDLKQMLDEKAVKELDYTCWTSKEQVLDHIKTRINYPKQENEHSAIHDARWNKKLHEFLNSL